MFRVVLLVAAIALFVIAALGAYGSLSGVNYSGLLAIGLACLATAVLDFEKLYDARRKR